MQIVGMLLAFLIWIVIISFLVRNERRKRFQRVLREAFIKADEAIVVIIKAFTPAIKAFKEAEKSMSLLNEKMSLLNEKMSKKGG